MTCDSGRYLVSFSLLFIFLRKQWQTTIWQRQTIDNHYMIKTPSTYRDSGACGDHLRAGHCWRFNFYQFGYTLLIMIPHKWIVLFARADWLPRRWLSKYYSPPSSRTKQNGFRRYIMTNKVTLWAASYSACVVYTKTITHLSVGESGGDNCFKLLDRGERVVQKSIVPIIFTIIIIGYM